MREIGRIAGRICDMQIDVDREMRGGLACQGGKEAYEPYE